MFPGRWYRCAVHTTQYRLSATNIVTVPTIYDLIGSLEYCVVIEDGTT